MAAGPISRTLAYKNLRPADVKPLLEGGQAWKYVDVRTTEEFREGHVPGAWNVPFAVRDRTGRMGPNPDFVTVMKKAFPAGSKIVLGCAVGGRSQRACELLATQGYTDLVNMVGGFVGMADDSGRMVEPGWRGSGFEIEAAAPFERTYEALYARS